VFLLHCAGKRDEENLKLAGKNVKTKIESTQVADPLGLNCGPRLRNTGLDQCLSKVLVLRLPNLIKNLNAPQTGAKRENMNFMF
jgi:hypothetical protein